MVWHGWEPDPITDPAASDVLAAYEAATEAHLPTVDCYLAGVEAWHRAHPDQSGPYARKQGVAVILGAKVSPRIPDE
jgi:hypothetical protein